MAWEHRRGGGRYYTQSRRVNGRVRRVYWGKGPIAEKVAEGDALLQRQREDRRQGQRAEAEAIRQTEQQFQYVSQICRRLVQDTLESAGFHRHHRGEWRRRRMSTPQEASAGRDSTKVVESGPQAANTNQAARTHLNFLERLIEKQLLWLYDKQPTIISGVRTQLAQLRAELLGPNPTIPERVLVEQILLAWLMTAEADVVVSQTRNDLAFREQFQRFGERANRRLLASVKAFAQLRHLRRPAVQVNIGERQVNIVAVGGVADPSGASAPLAKAPSTEERR